MAASPPTSTSAATQRRPMFNVGAGDINLI
jgi:hypothetical protein